MGEWALRNTSHHARQDGGCKAGNSHDPASESNSGRSLVARGETNGRLGLASANTERSRRTVNLQESAHRGVRGHYHRGREAWQETHSCVLLYDFRHTFLTRLGESGCDAWTLARIAGHSSIAISSRYVHPGEDAVLNAISRLGGHKIGHTQENAKPEQSAGRVLTQ
jgi:hypothetical protein